MSIFVGDDVVFLVFFFFSSRRRHTRYWRDWSSDVCSSDLTGIYMHLKAEEKIDIDDLMKTIEVTKMSEELFNQIGRASCRERV